MSNISMDKLSSGRGVSPDAKSLAGHGTAYVDNSDIDSSSEEDPFLDADVPLGRSLAAPPDPPTSTLGDVLQGPTNTNNPRHVTRRDRKSRTLAPADRRDDHATEAFTASQPPSTSGTLTLCVGGRKFLTARDTLTKESGYFKDLFENHAGNQQADGSYFVDADASLFEDILRYLRHGLLPVFWDSQTGHNHQRYAALLAGAQFFQIPRLMFWVKQKGYLQAAKQHFSAKMVPGPEKPAMVENTDVEVVSTHSFRRTKKEQVFDRVYVCPRAIDVHLRLEDCGKACNKARVNAAPQYVDKPATLEDGTPRYDETHVHETIILFKTVIFNHSACIAEK